MIYENYVITEDLDLDLTAMNHSCNLMYDLIKKSFTNDQEFSASTTASTQLFQKYNLLMYSYDQFYELYESIKSVFRNYCKDDEKYYIQSWLNYYQEGEYIDWHSHWAPELNTWHGFYCVNCESTESKTTYRLLPTNQEIDIISRDNMLVLSKSESDVHRTWPWNYKGTPRITIAFDIVPRQHIGPDWVLNHWIPL